MKITYYTGAGASYYSVPIIGELEKAFNFIGEKCNLIKPKNDDFKKFQLDFIDLMREASEEAATFGTIDTYANELSLTNNPKLIQLKNAMSLFFTIWQGLDFIDNVEIKSLCNGRELKKIDSRYFGLLCNYLENNNSDIVLSEDVNFITWNYDTQIELAIKKLIDEDNLDKIIDKFSYPNLKNLQNNQKVVHLNGIAGLIRKDTRLASLFKYINKSKKIRPLFSELINDLVYNNYSTSNLFSYAWEEDIISKTALERAIEIMKNTEVLVIIGYSFPTFNDSIDKKLFSGLNNYSTLRQVYFQDPNASKELLISRFGILDKKITIVNDTKQFVLPLELETINNAIKGLDYMVV